MVRVTELLMVQVLPGVSRNKGGGLEEGVTEYTRDQQPGTREGLPDALSGGGLTRQWVGFNRTPTRWVQSCLTPGSNSSDTSRQKTDMN